MIKHTTYSKSLAQSKNGLLLLALVCFFATFASKVQAACPDGPAIFTLSSSAIIYDGTTPADTRAFIVDNSTCAENNVIGDNFEDGYDYFIIPANSVLILDNNSILSFAADMAGSFPRPIRILIAGANNDAINGQIFYLKATGGGDVGRIIIRNNGSDIWFVDNAIDQNIIAPAPADCLNTENRSNSATAIIFQQDPPASDIVYSIQDLEQITNQGTLPVELTHFTARSADKGILLQWQTAWEQDNDHFEVQHSKDGAQFFPLTTVKGKGTTQQLNDYEYLHGEPIPGINYYRLKQVDFDGAFAYSEVLSVNRNGQPVANEFVVMPNPANRTFQLKSAYPLLEQPRLFLSNALGQVFNVKAVEAGNGYDVQLPAQLPAGTYQLHIVLKREVLYKSIVIH